MHIVHCTTASNVLTTPAFLMFIQELWSYIMLADGSVASMSGWMLSQLYDDIYPSHGYTALVEDEICKNYQAVLAS